MRPFLFALLFAFSTHLFSQNVTETEIKINDIINGTLFSTSKEYDKVVIVSVGSGPTDRFGNQAGAENNSIKFLAEELAKKGIAVFSYDKRFFVLAKNPDFKEESLRFEDLITDAKAVANYFQQQAQVKKLFLLGHSEGAMVMAVAAQDSNLTKLKGYVSLAGPGQPAGQILVEQIAKQAPFLKEETQKAVDRLNKGETFKLENQMLASLFRESVQPYLISWFKYDPAVEIAKVKAPILVVQGTSDIQVSENEAKILASAAKIEKPIIIDKMNHVLKIVNSQQENGASYNDKTKAISSELITAIFTFCAK